jgi:hypothetical protein
MNPAPGSVFYEPQLAAKPQLREKPRQGFETWKTAWKPSPNVVNSTVAMGIRAGLVLEGVRKTYRARYYNPTTGRFLSEDPIGFAGSGANLYAYASENPLRFTDPSGTCQAIANKVSTLSPCEKLLVAGLLLSLTALILGLVSMASAGFAGLIAGFLISAEIMVTVETFFEIGVAVGGIAVSLGHLGQTIGVCQ